MVFRSKKQVLHPSLSILIGAGFALVGCAYRFTNQSVRLPVGVKNLAIEAVYDTSREVLPHELFWSSIQRAFAADGHLQLSSQQNADILLRAHLKDATDLPSGAAEVNGAVRDANRGIDPGNPNDFRVLSQAGEFTTKQDIRFGVYVEIIDLSSKQIIFSNSYAGSRNFRSFRSEALVANKRSHFLLFDEARKTKFKEISDEIAQNIVRDFLVGR